MAAHSENLIWIDLEMTGLDCFNDVIIEIATIVTDKHLNILAEGPTYAIETPEELLSGMDEWNTKQHNKSGLVERIRKVGVTVKQLESTANRLTYSATYFFVSIGDGADTFFACLPDQSHKPSIAELKQQMLSKGDDQTVYGTFF